MLSNPLPNHERDLVRSIYYIASKGFGIKTIPGAKYTEEKEERGS